MFPFDATKPNFGGGFTDLLEVFASRFWGEVGAGGAGVEIEPVSHFGLVFCSGMFVYEYVGDLAVFTVVGTWNGALAGLRGAAWNAEGVPEESVFVQDGARGARKVWS